MYYELLQDPILQNLPIKSKIIVIPKLGHSSLTRELKHGLLPYTRIVREKGDHDAGQNPVALGNGLRR